jgi:4-hydroxybenzoate polyprenyltransferase
MTILLRFLRFPNLCIVALSQYLMRYWLLLPVLARNSAGELRVNDLAFCFFITMTVATAAAGYVINDIIDEPIDRINKPEKRFVGVYFSQKNAYFIYTSLLLTALLCSFILSTMAEFYWFLVCCIAANAVLFAYSKWLKQMPFWGNFTVAIFTACVAFGVAMPIMQPPYTLAQTQIFTIFANYCGFALLANLWRELIKDLEDIAGDSRYGCRTLPIVFGIATTKKIGFGIAAILLIALLLFSKFLVENALFFGWIWLIATVAFPLCASLYLLYIAEEKTDYTLISRIAKLMMVGGLVFLFIFKT